MNLLLLSRQTGQRFRGRSWWRLRRKRRPLGAGDVAKVLAAFAVGLGLPHAGKALRSMRAILLRWKEGAGVPEVHARLEAAERMPSPPRAGTIDLGPGPTRTEPSHELD